MSFNHCQQFLAILFVKGCNFFSRRMGILFDFDGTTNHRRELTFGEAKSPTVDDPE